MSNSTQPSMADIEATLDSYNFTGGYPTSKDFAPSIIFSIVYIAILPLLIWRVTARSSRTHILIRPVIFVCVRVGTFILRAIMSKTSYEMGELIAELVLVSVGFLFLVSPVLSLWQRQIVAEVPKKQQPSWMRTFQGLGHGLLVAAIITAIISSTKMSGNNPDRDEVETLRRVSYILSLAVVVVTLLGVVRTHMHLRLDVRPTGYLIVVLCFLLIVAVFRVVQIYTTNHDAPVRTLAAFFVLQVTMEMIAVFLLLAINLNDLFPPPVKITPEHGDAESTEGFQYNLHKSEV